MSAERNFIFPDGIDEPPMILFWEIPQFIIMMSLFCLGLIMRDALIFVLCAVGTYQSGVYFKRVNSKAKRNQLKHAGYYIGLPGDPHLKKWPSSYRDYCGK